MSRQICFFSDEVDIKELFTNVKLDNVVLLNKTGETVTLNNFFNCVDDYFKNEHSLIQTWFLACPNSKIEYMQKGDYSCINPLKSDVIEFHHCTKVPQKILDMSFVNNQFMKNGFIVIDDGKKYTYLMEELKKNPQYIDNPVFVKNGFEHGRFWYNYDSSSKDKSGLIQSFNTIKRYISKNYILSKSKFAYIGKNAYDKSLKGTFVPCSGKNIILFPERKIGDGTMIDES